MDLFDSSAREQTRQKSMPLAARMRPVTLDEYVGQEEIVGKGRLLRRAIEADQLSSVIFYGPPGSGKTTLAQIIANSTGANYRIVSAVTSGIADVREVLRFASDELKLYGRRTVLFIDEIHRFNKSQQDALLPAVENGTVILIGATTENPFFEVNSALISRSRIFRLQPLQKESIFLLLQRALKDPRGYADMAVEISEEALWHWADVAGGDVRTAYNAMELAVLTTEPEEDGVRRIDLAIAEESIQKRNISYDKKGDWHYDVISAFIKSMRGSDPNAVLHWLARMTEAGEQPDFIARRIMICAAEDVGLADPMALVIATSAAQAVHHVGWPEARIILAEAAVYVACAPKSNAAYMGINEAIADLYKKPFQGVPIHLRDSNYQSAKQFGHGKGYQYPHSFPGHYVKQQYLPDDFKDRVYYQPSNNGKEQKIRELLERLHEGKYRPKNSEKKTEGEK